MQEVRGSNKYGVTFVYRVMIMTELHFVEFCVSTDLERCRINNLFYYKEQSTNNISHLKYTASIDNCPALKSSPFDGKILNIIN